MDLDLPAETERVRKTARAFAEEVVAPQADGFDARAEFPLEIVRQMGQLGFFGLPFPERYGGTGPSFLSFCIAVEELARADSSVAVTLAAGAGLGAMVFHLHGSEEQKESWLVPLARGEILGAFAITEPGGGSDTGAIRTRARREGDAWVIDGAKAFITNAGTQISRVVTLTAVAGEARGHKQIAALAVPHGTPGLEVGAAYRKLGWRASDTRPLSFRSCRVPASNQLGPLGRYRDFLSILSAGRIAIAALAVGLAQGCLDACLAHARRRSAFGRPIGAHQMIQAKIADMATRVAVGRNQAYRAVWLKEQGRPYTTEAAIAKLFATEAAVECARDAVQIHGGRGIEESLVARHYRDAKVLEVGEGTSEIHRLLIARALGLPVHLKAPAGGEPPAGRHPVGAPHGAERGPPGAGRGSASAGA